MEETAGSSGTIDVNRVNSLMSKFVASWRRAIGKKELADVFGVSTRTLDRMRDRDQIPEPFVVGLRVLKWDRDEIMAWLAAHAPDSQTWQQMRTANAGNNVGSDVKAPQRKGRIA